MSSELAGSNIFQLESDMVTNHALRTARRILLVDDSAGTAQVTARLFGLLGHEVAMAHSGQAAIDSALHLKPDVILLDLKLPDMNGCQVASKLRESADFTHTLLVALTGYSDPETRESALKAGFDEFLVKPAPMEAFEALFLHPKLRAAAL